jgi:hypothetical protein
VVRVLERVAGLDAEERLVRVGVGLREVVDVARRDERQVGLGGELGELGIDALLHLEPGVLQLDVGVVAAEDLREPVEVVARVLRPVLLESLADAAGEAPREGDDARGMRLQELPVDARLRVVALEVAERGELDQVGVAGVRLGEEGQVRVAARARAAVVGDVDLAAENRLHALLLRRLVELDGAGQGAVVGERHRGHLELGGAGRERGDPARPVEDRVLAVDMQMDEARAHGRAIVRPPPDDPGRVAERVNRSTAKSPQLRGEGRSDRGSPVEKALMCGLRRRYSTRR